MAEFNERKWSLGEIVKASEGILSPDRLELLEMALLLDSVHNEERDVRDWRLTIASSVLRNRNWYFESIETGKEVGRAKSYVEFSASQYLGIVSGKNVIDELDNKLRTASAYVFMMNYDQSDRHPFLNSIDKYKVDIGDLWNVVKQLHRKITNEEWNSEFEEQDLADFLMRSEFQGIAHNERLTVPIFDEIQNMLEQQEFTRRTRRPY